MAAKWKLRELFQIAKLTFLSLTHNSCRSKTYIVDAAFEPVYWIIDHVANFMGLIFVVLVTLLTASVVSIWYIYLLPVIRNNSFTWIVMHVIFGHWLLINILFHYFKAVFTSPGIPPQGRPMESIAGALVCRKCIQPKPPRTHHCSVCNNCYLKMDHHCPWMNNCIGFYNHRYFILFCVFMWLGTVYVCLTSFDLFTYHFFHPGTVFDEKKQSTNQMFLMFGLGDLLQNLIGHVKSENKHALDKAMKSYRGHPSGIEVPHGYEHIAIIYLFLLCSAVTCALGLLNLWHFWLISHGETSIEVHINSKERRQSAKRGMGYNNPYDYGVKQNWKYLLGLYHGRSFLSVLFPSAHLPEGDGLKWPRNKKVTYYPNPNIQNKKRWTFGFSAIRKLFRC